MAKTRLGLSGISRSPYGSFAGKTPETPVTARPPGLHGIARQFMTIIAARLGGVLQ